MVSLEHYPIDQNTYNSYVWARVDLLTGCTQPSAGFVQTTSANSRTRPQALGSLGYLRAAGPSRSHLEDIPLWPDRLPNEPTELFRSEFLNQMIAEDLADFPGLAASFEANRIRGFEAEFPVQIWQGTLDDVVLLSDTAELVADLEASGMEIDFQVVEGAGHVNLAFGFVAFQEMRTEESIAWVKSRLED